MNKDRYDLSEMINEYGKLNREIPDTLLELARNYMDEFHSYLGRPSANVKQYLKEACNLFEVLEMKQITLPCRGFTDKEIEQIKELWLPEFLDFMKVFLHGAEKHGAFNFLEKDGKKCSRKDMFASKQRHAASVFMRQTHDDESGLHHSLHECARTQIEYVRHERVLIHPEDQ